MCIEFLTQNGILLHFLSHLLYQYEVLLTYGSEKTFHYLGEVIDVIQSVWSNSAQNEAGYLALCIVSHLITFMLPFKVQD